MRVRKKVRFRRNCIFTISKRFLKRTKCTQVETKTKKKNWHNGILKKNSTKQWIAVKHMSAHTLVRILAHTCKHLHIHTLETGSTHIISLNLSIVLLIFAVNSQLIFKQHTHAHTDTFCINWNKKSRTTTPPSNLSNMQAELCLMFGLGLSPHFE